MKYWVYIFYAFCFFPYVDLIGLGTDTQPNALLLAPILILAMKSKKLNGPILLLWLMFLFGLAISFSSSLSSFDTLKNLFNYLSPGVIAFVGYNILDKQERKIDFRFFVSVVLLYLCVGLVQMYYLPDFLIGIVNGEGRGQLQSGRGVISLCPEPAFYGSMCLFLMIFSLLHYGPAKNKLIVPLLLFQLLVLSRSATAIAILAFSLILFGIWQILRFNIKYSVICLSVLGVSALLFNNYRNNIADTRVGTLTEAFIDDPLLITQFDASVGVRLTGAYAPFMNISHNRFLPQGMGQYQTFLRRVYKEGNYRKLLSRYIIDEKDKLGGSVNMVLFQLGFLGLVFPFAIWWAFKDLIKENKSLLAFLIFMVLLFTQIQMMHAMIGFVIAVALFQTKQKWLQRKVNTRAQASY
ncbi:MAG: hypothetical protein HKN09_13415 [Saprospiraceae bacterium]|nr:hypothetical protein [Saprospiraceae bacterium]